MTGYKYPVISCIRFGDIFSQVSKPSYIHLCFFSPPGVVFTIIRVTDGTGTLEPVEFVIILAQLQIFSIPGIRWNFVRSQIGIWNVVRLFKNLPIAIVYDHH